MLVNLYDKQSARMLAMATVANATGPRSRSTQSRARVIDVGGGWNLRSWRDSLRRLTDRGTVVALAVRTQPNQRHLTDAEWEQISRRLARHAGFGQQPWIAVRTSPTTVAVLSDSTSGPPKMDAARSFISTVVIDRGLQSGRGSADAGLESRLTFLRSPVADEQPVIHSPMPSPVPAPRDSAGTDDGIGEIVVGRAELTDKGLLAAVSMQWERMTASPDRGNRITMAASLAWNHTYSDAFEFGYNALAKAAADQFATLHQRVTDNPATDAETANAVRDLFLIPHRAMPIRIETPDVPRNTMMIATRAGLERPADQTIPEAIVRAVCGNAAAIGGLHGAIAATADIEREWKAHRRNLDVAVLGDELVKRIDGVFTELHRELRETLAIRDGSAGPAPAGARSSFAAPPGVQTPPSVARAVEPVSLNKFRRSR